MINWNRTPFVRILLPLAAGIIVSLNLEAGAGWMVIALPALVVLYILWVIPFRRLITRRYRWGPGIVIYAVLFLAGYQLGCSKLLSAFVEGGYIAEQEGFIVVRLHDLPAERTNSYRVTANLVASCDSSGWKSARGKVMIYLAKDDRVRWLKYGDRLLIRSALRPVRAPLNPGEFNYKRYLKYEGVVHQVYTDSVHWQQIYPGKISIVIAWSKAIRYRLLKILRDHGIQGKELAVASAILLGYDEYLDEEQKRQFSGAGAMHILCVSGLHVGIIAVVLNALLIVLNRNRYLKVLKLIILLVLIWSYAAITGFSPSVLRAATMFSFIYAGRSFRRKASIYNMLAASAFVLLVADPFMITRVGFQLSYLAVLGIVVFFGPLDKLCNVDNRILEWTWQLTLVSLSATLATFPLSLFYFHQFPNLFLVTNLVAIPASFLILYNGILLLAFSFLPIVAGLLGVTLEFILQWLNHIVGFLEGIPFSTTRNVFISLPELLLLSGILACVAILIHGRKPNLLFPILAMAALMAGLGGWVRYQASQQVKLFCFSLRGHTALEFVMGDASVFMGDPALLGDTLKLAYATSGNRMKCGISRTGYHEVGAPAIGTPWLRKIGNHISFEGLQFVLVDSSLKAIPGDPRIPVDYMLILSGAGQNLKQLEQVFDPGIVILDTSLPPWEADRWRRDCMAGNQEFRDLAEGCYRVDLRSPANKKRRTNAVRL